MRDDHDLDQAPWMEYAGKIESDDPDSGLKVDEVVYGAVD
jgi:hypothetical protein